MLRSRWIVRKLPNVLRIRPYVIDLMQYLQAKGFSSSITHYDLRNIANVYSQNATIEASSFNRAGLKDCNIIPIKLHNCDIMGTQLQGCELVSCRIGSSGVKVRGWLAWMRLLRKTSTEKWGCWKTGANITIPDPKSSLVFSSTNLKLRRFFKRTNIANAWDCRLAAIHVCCLCWALFWTSGLARWWLNQGRYSCSWCFTDGTWSNAQPLLTGIRFIRLTKRLTLLLDLACQTLSCLYRSGFMSEALTGSTLMLLTLQTPSFHININCFLL